MFNLSKSRSLGWAGARRLSARRRQTPEGPLPRPRCQGGPRRFGVFAGGMGLLVLGLSGLLSSAAGMEGSPGAVVPSSSRLQETATLKAAENLRAEPAGTILGRLEGGVTLPVVSRRDRWVQVEVVGWIWTRSLQATNRGGFQVAVAPEGGENLRAEPQGRILGRLSRGTLLERLDTSPGWTRVRRVAWLWAASVEIRIEGGAGGSPAASGASGPPGPAPAGWWFPGPGGAVLLSAPDGDTLARAVPGAGLQVLAREGNWIRVRMEGWAWAPAADPADSARPAIPAALTVAQVRQDPGAYRGRVVSWDLRFVSLERAEKVRTDFYEGEPFLLTRTPPPENAFVYVAVPPDRLNEVKGLIPLERIRVTGRIRTGSAVLTGNPILDLMEVVRLSGR